ncbi:MAG: hypothetical protein KKB20_16395 [Proteobacteria bacterium]|nr:hypothetical protein [Pseudomonadota bacterium]
MPVDDDLLRRFEEGLDPSDIGASAVSASILGYGEISTVFRIGDDETTAFKRMPLFGDRPAAEAYADRYSEYCRLLREAGLKLPEGETRIVEPTSRPVVLYITQARIPTDRFAHQLIHVLEPNDIRDLLEGIVTEIDKVWRFNQDRAPALRLAIDGQLSNWARTDPGEAAGLYFVDTSTPMYLKDGLEQLDPELLLQAAPGFMRGVFRIFFLEEVMTRYYDPRQVFTDLTANLFKEQRPDLVPFTVEVINQGLGGGLDPLTVAEVERYYRGDRRIWSVALAMRRLDRWIKTRLQGRRYEFILPGEIRR